MLKEQLAQNSQDSRGRKMPVTCAGNCWFQMALAVLTFVVLVHLTGTIALADKLIDQPVNKPLAESEKELEAARKIEKALESETVFDFVEVPLREVAEILSKRHGINITLANLAIEASGQDPDVLITRNLKGISLGSALHLMLQDVELTYSINYESLVIAPRNYPRITIETRVYPVRDLVETVGPDGKAMFDFDNLMKAVTETIEPESWKACGGKGTIAAVPASNALTCYQDVEVHRRIRALFDVLRSIRDQQQK
jgi:hypothetical protein